MLGLMYLRACRCMLKIPEDGITMSYRRRWGSQAQSHRHPFKTFLWRNGVISAPFMVEVSSWSPATTAQREKTREAGGGDGSERQGDNPPSPLLLPLFSLLLWFYKKK